MLPLQLGALGSSCSGGTEYHGPFKTAGFAIAISWGFRANISSWLWWQMPVIPALGLIQSLYRLRASLGESLPWHSKTNQQNKYINRFQHTSLERKKKTNQNFELGKYWSSLWHNLRNLKEPDAIDCYTAMPWRLWNWHAAASEPQEKRVYPCKVRKASPLLLRKCRSQSNLPVKIQDAVQFYISET